MKLLVQRVLLLATFVAIPMVAIAQVDLEIAAATAAQKLNPASSPNNMKCVPTPPRTVGCEPTNPAPDVDCIECNMRCIDSVTGIICTVNYEDCNDNNAGTHECNGTIVCIDPNTKPLIPHCFQMLGCENTTYTEFTPCGPTPTPTPGGGGGGNS